LGVIYNSIFGLELLIPKQKRMTKTKQLLLFSCVFFFGMCSLKAQNGTVASGGDASGTGGSVSSSIGQIDFIAENGTTGSVAQGLQQPFEIYIITGIEATGINLSASVFPNPTAEQVTISVKDLLPGMSYTLSDAQGKLIKTGQLETEETTLSLVELKKAAYFITIKNNSKEVKTFKIIKN
jgi:hypothetical protein